MTKSGTMAPKKVSHRCSAFRHREGKTGCCVQAKKGGSGKSVGESERGSLGDQPGCGVILDSGCVVGEAVDEGAPGDAVRVLCTNHACPAPRLIHAQCYEAWEDHLVKILSTVSWARSWTEAQKRANLWDKKGYLLIQKLCRCRCAAGKLRRDLDYKPPPHAADAQLQHDPHGRKKKGPRKQLPTLVQTDRGGRFRPRHLLDSPHHSPGAPSSAPPLPASTDPAFSCHNLEQEWLRSRRRNYSPAALSHFLFSPASVRSVRAQLDDDAIPSPVTPPLDFDSPGLPPPHLHHPLLVTEDDLFEALRAVLLERAAVAEEDPQLQTILTSTAPTLAADLAAKGGLVDFLRLSHSPTTISVYEDSQRRRWLFLPSSHNAQQRSKLQDELTLDIPPGLAPLPTSNFYYGVIQNVFPRYGYIECPDLDSNVFFVPSMVVCPLSGESLKDAADGGSTLNLAERLRRGQRVRFSATAQEEKSGCRWMATRVAVLTLHPNRPLSPAPHLSPHLSPPLTPASPGPAPSAPVPPRHPAFLRTASQPIFSQPSARLPSSLPSSRPPSAATAYGLFSPGLGLGEALLASFGDLHSPQPIQQTPRLF